MIRILIVDDTRSVHAFVKSLCANAKNIHLESVYNGKEGVERLQRPHSFDLVLLDWEMPVMTGPEALAEIVKIAGRPPVMMMTTKNQPDEIILMLKNGAAEYLMKPFTADILFQKISSVIGKEVENAAA